MEIKTITYQRVLNLGNYESKRLEISGEISPGDDIDVEIFWLMKKVERQIRQEAQLEIELEISRARKELRELKDRLRELKQEMSDASESQQPQDVPDMDSIPFESGDAAKDSGIPEGF